VRRKLIKILLGLIGLLLFLFGLYGLWVWVQTNLSAALQSGALRASDLGRSLLPPLPLVYGLLAGLFILVTIILIWVIYRLVAADDIPPDH